MCRISAPGITFNNPGIIDLFSYKVYGGPYKGGYGIGNCNTTRCTYCPLVPKGDTFYVTDGSPMTVGYMQSVMMVCFSSRELVSILLCQVNLMKLPLILVIKV